MGSGWCMLCGLHYQLHHIPGNSVHHAILLSIRQGRQHNHTVQVHLISLFPTVTPSVLGDTSQSPAKQIRDGEIQREKQITVCERITYIRLLEYK
jgi:hypothetical protein